MEPERTRNPNVKGKGERGLSGTPSAADLHSSPFRRKAMIARTCLREKQEAGVISRLRCCSSNLFGGHAREGAQIAMTSCP